MTPPAAHHLCDRARSWAALVPDGELSELERTLLRSHVTRCGSCRRFAADVAATATALRNASFEPLSRPVAVPAWQRRRALARLRSVGAAAAVAVMALGIASRAPVENSDRTTGQPTRVADFSGDQAELQLLRRERRQAIAGPFDEMPAKHFGNQPV